MAIAVLKTALDILFYWLVLDTVFFCFKLHWPRQVFGRLFIPSEHLCFSDHWLALPVTLNQLNSALVSCGLPAIESYVLPASLSAHTYLSFLNNPSSSYLTPSTPTKHFYSYNVPNGMHSSSIYLSIYYSILNTPSYYLTLSAPTQHFQS